MTNARLITLLLVSTLAAACTNLPGKETAIAEFVSEQKSAAQELEKEGRMTESLAVWRSLKPVGFDKEVEQSIDSLEKRIDKSAKANLASGRRSYSRGNSSQGDYHMLKVLALIPGHPEAKKSLKKSSSARAQAQQNNKSQSAGQMALRTPKEYEAPVKQRLQKLYANQDYKAMIALENAIDPQKDAISAQLVRKAHVRMADQAEQSRRKSDALQHLQAAMLFQTSENDPLLARSLTLRKELSTQWYQEGSRQMSQDLDAAVAALQKSLSFNPYNTRAKRKLAQAQILQRNLKKIEGAR